MTAQAQVARLIEAGLLWPVSALVCPTCHAELEVGRRFVGCSRPGCFYIEDAEVFAEQLLEARTLLPRAA